MASDLWIKFLIVAGSIGDGIVSIGLSASQGPE